MRLFWVILFVSFSYHLFSYAVPYLVIDGKSMLPTLQDGSMVFATKNKIFNKKIERGDIVTFSVDDSEDHYIKRVIGIPGDTIQIEKGILILNQKYIERNINNEMNEFVEDLSNDVSYKILDQEDSYEYDNTKRYLVPEGHYFVLGDNRDNSRDSRDVGFIAYKDIEEIMLPETNMIYRLSFLF